ncbi:MAG: secondary thiamine-phosphate synthase enzyme YjbQ [Desulfomonilaceae bacterium]
MESIQIKTHARQQFVDITGLVADAARRSGIKEGLATVFVPHTTAGITINEAADPSVATDIQQKLAQLVPHSAQYQHTEGNSDAHIKAALVGSSVHLIISKGSLMLGTWQGIFFCEFDGPRTRKAFIQVLGE